MKPSEREFILYLEDMLESMNLIADYIAGHDMYSFKKDRKSLDAVVRNLEIIGEAGKNVPENIKSDYPAMPWRQMYGLRNMITHEYFGLDYEIIWDIVKTKLPQNKETLTDIIEYLKQKQTTNSIQ